MVDLLAHFCKMEAPKEVEIKELNSTIWHRPLMACPTPKTYDLLQIDLPASNTKQFSYRAVLVPAKLLGALTNRQCGASDLLSELV